LVNDFLDGLEEVLVPQGMREMQALLERKKSYLVGNSEYSQPYSDTIPPWDYAYYSRLAQESLNVDYTKSSEYFPLQSSVLAMLKVFTSFFQLRFIAISLEAMTGSQWHEDVKAWSVWEERDASRGDLLSLFRRLAVEAKQVLRITECQPSMRSTPPF
jgi:metallopeptidase MepB